VNKQPLEEDVEGAANALIPRLGFGTAHLMGRIGSRESTRLVHAALDAGISHFDTARVYGLGDTEQMLGRALQKRKGVTIYTKVGLGSSRHSRFKALLHSAVRPLAAARARLDGGATAFPVPPGLSGRNPDFTVGHVRTSVETSLKMLRRDAIDGLLLHEASVEDVRPELLELLETLVREGKVRRYGVASGHASLVRFQSYDLPGDILQQAGGPFLEPISPEGNFQIILHSLFGAKGHDLKPFLSWLNESPRERDQLKDVLVAERMEEIPILLFSYTATKWPHATVVFASTTPKHIHANASAMANPLQNDSVVTVANCLHRYKNQV